MNRQLLYFRPGEEARMLARCQFGVVAGSGRAGATLTYPIKGYPWRNNVRRTFEFNLGRAVTDLLFSEVARIRRDHPSECLSHEQLWNDMQEKANGITRDRETGTLCYSVLVIAEDGSHPEQYGLRENSSALLTSELYKIVSELVAPYEKI
jgi:hypothetical protein